jgi:serine/threonine protein phosphatase 1
MHRAFIVIGDIHGCRDQLAEVLEKCAPWAGRPYVFLGDYIDRGPDSDGVITLARQLDATCLKGNHEQSLLNYCARAGRLPEPTADNHLPRLSEENLRWLQSSLRPSLETDDYIFVHAGLNPAVPVGEQEESDLLWSRYEGGYPEAAPKLVIHGHAVVDALTRVGNRININTGCGFGGPLTALVLPEMDVVHSGPSPSTRERTVAAMKRELEELMAGGAELEDA